MGSHIPLRPRHLKSKALAGCHGHHGHVHPHAFVTFWFNHH
jgi:hypothetical protein